jgi:hypothetical protein
MSLGLGKIHEEALICYATLMRAHEKDIVLAYFGSGHTCIVRVHRQDMVARGFSAKCSRCGNGRIKVQRGGSRVIAVRARKLSAR